MAKFFDKFKKDKSEKTETSTVDEIKEIITSDDFSPEERKEIVKMVMDDIDHGKKVQENNIKQKQLDLKHYHSEPPSKIEGLDKKTWQSDRNLGLARAIADSFQATYLATCWNPESIHFVATRLTEKNNRHNQEKFTKWGMGAQEANVKPQVDDFVHNKIIFGASFFKIYRKIWEEWVDKRIPKKDKEGNTYKYEIKVEKVRFEKGVIENIPEIDDILMPEYGKNIQELPYFIHVLHLDGETVLGYIKSKIFKPLNVDDYKQKLYNHAFDDKKRILGEERLKAQGITKVSDMTDIDVRRLDIDVYEWYGMYNKGNRTEKFRFRVDARNEEFLSGKPIRKINRSGKIPFAGGSLNREPGQLRGPSTMEIIAPVINAFNNVFNQKSDFQYVTNCPFGFYNPDEGYTADRYSLEPMVMYPVSGKPSDSVYFPSLARSMSWAESDIRILFEILERLTGASTYFNTASKNKTATQDLLVDKHSENRFSLGVSRILDGITEAIGMWFELYQDYPPKTLAERVIGEDGKKMFDNITIDTLRGDVSVQMTPDVVAGSKAHRKQIQLWAFGASQQIVWMNPQINPEGNWQMAADTLSEVLDLSEDEVVEYMGEKPKGKFDKAELDNEWIRFLNGEDFDPPEGETPLAIQHMEGHTKQKEEKYQELSEEARPLFDAHLFKTMVNAMKFMKKMQQEQVVNNVATNMISQGLGAPGQPQEQNPQANQPVAPQVNNPMNSQPAPGVPGQGEQLA